MSLQVSIVDPKTLKSPEVLAIRVIIEVKQTEGVEAGFNILIYGCPKSTSVSLSALMAAVALF